VVRWFFEFESSRWVVCDFATREMRRTFASVSAFQTIGMMVEVLWLWDVCCGWGGCWVDVVGWWKRVCFGGGGWAMESGRGLRVF
jgi:hypothetical protein